ncbi:Arc family DNA-binding protein [Sulfitobacter sp. OXR-159]|uniref:Arc family DNA-binding protein n=1 Tax=Sulfitobacter sp. OXR-159 TaxID=3100174 RepID=UPI002AC93BED|nr:Arc family DNA-binding protein [Sulfitobacter sp. OXR-159]WPZ30769.1 Arc family DNA-binding protein [Sulfitobacter sp. OXR-159]WPZ30870.1 Arc family DNA-binding protein [Sulfitobacter sp. OXR-159]
MARPPASKQVQVNFRMPSDLKARIEAAADESNRSTTAEIVAALEEKFPPPPVDDWSYIWERSKKILDEMDVLIAGYKDPEANIDDLSSRFAALSKKHKLLLDSFSEASDPSPDTVGDRSTVAHRIKPER